MRQSIAKTYFGDFQGSGATWLPLSRQNQNVQATLVEDSEHVDRPTTINERIKQLPEVIRIPFEEAVNDIKLEGWEDQWFSTAVYNIDSYGTLPEPKIDFVYNCWLWLKLA